MKNSVIKTITLLLIAAMLTTAFAACNKPDVPVDASPAPTEQQAEAPTNAPTQEPVVTEEPTEEPTEVPTEEPTEVPTEEPTEAPTEEPTPEPTPDPTLPEDPEDIGDCIKDAEILFRISYGDDEDNVGLKEPDDPEDPFYDGRDWYNGPDAFVVADGKIYILDTIKYRVVVWDGEDLSFIPFSDADSCGYYSVMAIVDDKIYVGNTDGEISIVSVYDMTGQKLGNIPMPEDAEESGLNQLLNVEDQLVLVSHDLTFYDLVDGEFVKKYNINVNPKGKPRFTVTSGELEFEMYAGDNTLIGIDRIIGDRVYCRVYEFNPESAAIDLELSYRIYDIEGNLLGATVVDRAKMFARPNSVMYISSDGEIYVMCLMQDGVYITKPNLRLTYTSHLGEE